MNNIEIGNYIKKLRKENGYTQKQLAEKLNVSFQAVSKWETGETLPDTSLLLTLANELNTSVERLLNGGKIIMKENTLISVKNIIDGFKYLLKVKDCFGEKSTFWLGLVEGINTKMNMDLLDALENHKEVLYTEVILQYINNENCKVDIDEVRKYIKKEKYVALIERFNNK
jgi:transcriptional regulator with XRE-family HTH domain